MTLKNFLSDKDSKFDKEGAFAPKVGADGITLPSLTVKVIKRHIWLLVLAAIGFLLNMPIAVALVWSNLDRERVVRSTYLESYASDMQVLFNVGSAAIVAAGAVLAAFTLFRYLHSRNQVDFYHSLPIKREKFYAANLLAGLLIFLLPYLAAHILALPLLAGSGMLTYFDPGQYVLGIVLIIFAYMIMFALAGLAMLLSGSLGGAIKILLATYALGPILAAMLTLLGDVFLANYANVDSVVLCLLRASVAERFAMLVMNDIPLTVCWQDWVFGGAILLAAVAAGLWLYKKRDSECAGATLAFGWQKPVFKYPYVVLAGIFGGMMMYTAGDCSVIWLAFGWVFFTVFAAQALEIFIQRDFRAVKRDLRGALISLVVAGVVLGAYGLDVFGYEKWQPSADKVAEIYIDGYNLEGYPYAGNWVKWLDNSRNRDDYYSVNPADYYGSSSQVTVSGSALPAMIEILNSEPGYYGTYTVNEYGDSYYDFCDSNYARVVFKMKNGGYKVRYMEYGGLMANYDTYAALYDTPEMRAQMCNAQGIPDGLTMKFESLMDYTGLDYQDWTPKYVVPSEKVAEFWNVYSSELAELTSDQLLKEMPLGQLSLRMYRGYRLVDDGMGGTYEDWDNSLWNSLTIYSGMPATVELLRSYFGDDMFTGGVREGKLVSIMEYTPKNPELVMVNEDGLPLGSDVENGNYVVGYSDSRYPEEDRTEEVTYTGWSVVTTTSDNVAISGDNGTHTVAKVDLSRADEIIANTVGDSQLCNCNYYAPWRRTDCLKYYEFYYTMDDGYSVTRTRYVLP